MSRATLDRQRNATAQRLVAVFVTALAVVGIAAIPAAGSETVDPDEYLDAICSANATFSEETDDLLASLRASTPRLDDGFSRENADQIRESSIKLIAGDAALLEKLVAEWEGAGVPRIKNGALFARAVIKRGRALLTGLERLEGVAKTIDVASEQRFAASLSSFGTDLKAIRLSLRQGVRHERAFKNTPEIFEPIVTSLTRNAEPCAA